MPTTEGDQDTAGENQQRKSKHNGLSGFLHRRPPLQKSPGLRPREPGLPKTRKPTSSRGGMRRFRQERANLAQSSRRVWAASVGCPPQGGRGAARAERGRPVADAISVVV